MTTKNTQPSIDGYMSPSKKGGAVAGTFKTPREQVPKFPNTKAYAVDPSKLKSRFGDRYKLLSEREETARAIAYEDFSQIPPELQQFLPQDHPYFQQFRQIRRYTGSTVGEYLGFHDKKVAEKMDVPPGMHITDELNDLYEQMLMYTKHGMIPRATLSQPGPCFAANGKDHEDNVNATLIETIPTMVFHEVGTICLTNDHLAFMGVYDAFDAEKKPLRNLKSSFAITPDYECYAPTSTSTDEHGATVFSSQIERMAGENKVPTVFIPKNEKSTEFFGADFSFVRRKTWEHPHTYYIPQVMCEMLALKCKSLLFSCWTFGNGMTTWKIEADVEYISIMLTVLEYLYCEFVLQGKSVPTNYFYDLPLGDSRRAVYMRLVEKTVQIANSAPVYMKVSGDKTSEISSSIGVLSKDTYVQFPVIPDFLPPYHVLALYGRRFFEDYACISWPMDWKCLRERRHNLKLLLDTSISRFACSVADNIVETHASKYPEAIRAVPIVSQAGIEKAETYAVLVYQTVCELYGRPMFGTKLSVTGFYRNLVESTFARFDALVETHSKHAGAAVQYMCNMKKAFSGAARDVLWKSYEAMFSEPCIRHVIASCMSITGAMLGPDAPDTVFGAAKVSDHIDVLSRLDIAENTDCDTPGTRHVEALLCMLVLFEVVERNIEAAAAKKKEE